MFTIKLNDLEKSYSWISKKHDQTSINLTNLIKLIFGLCYVWWNQTVLHLYEIYYTKIYKKATFHVSELMLTPLSPFDIKCKKPENKKGGSMPHPPPPP